MLVLVYFSYELISLEDDLPGCHKELVPGQFQSLKKSLPVLFLNFFYFSLPVLAQTMMWGYFEGAVEKVA